ncbi:MAG TPA: hypothetical protein DCE23_04465 [Firmicutes bacterium]|nr:hypothetical protein [Bacillota bacterium]
METFVETILNITEPKTLFLLCGIFIFTDILTGYIKAIKFKDINSSISRDGYIKKIGWIVAVLLGFIVDVLVDLNIFLVGSAVVCIATEGISVYENLGEVGVNLRFAKYFEKLKEKSDE